MRSEIINSFLEKNILEFILYYVDNQIFIFNNLSFLQHHLVLANFFYSFWFYKPYFHKYVLQYDGCCSDLLCKTWFSRFNQEFGNLFEEWYWMNRTLIISIFTSLYQGPFAFRFDFIVFLRQIKDVLSLKNVFNLLCEWVKNSLCNI